MSKALKWGYDDIFQSRREKISMLLSEIIFLKNKSRNYKDREFIKIALKKLEYLLNIIRDNETDLSEKDFNKIILIIYKIFREITEEIE